MPGARHYCEQAGSSERRDAVHTEQHRGRPQPQHNEMCIRDRPYPERDLRLRYSRPNQENGPVGAAIYACKRMADPQYL